jgi:hypothetical protein
MKTGYYANLGDHRFTFGLTNIEVLEILPPNTPIRVVQIIYVEYDGREVISDGEELLKTSADLWHWIQDIHHLVYLEFSHPGECKWTIQNEELSIYCEHRSTLVYWTSEILKFYRLATFKNYHRLALSNGQNCILLTSEEFVSTYPKLNQQHWNLSAN